MTALGPSCGVCPLTHADRAGQAVRMNVHTCEQRAQVFVRPGPLVRPGRRCALAHPSRPGPRTDAAFVQMAVRA